MDFYAGGKTVQVPTDFLLALVIRLQEFADNTADLEELINKIIESID